MRRKASPVAGALGTALLVLTAGAAAGAQSAADTAVVDSAGAIAVIPRPARLEAGRGRFVLTERTVVWTDAAGEAVARQFARDLEPATGFALAVRVGGAVPAGAVVFRRDPSLRRLGPEGYALDVRPGGVVARAPEAAGLFYAVQTMRQLLPPAAGRAAPIAPGPNVTWGMPAVRVEDAPRFAWRGAHLDVARHFMPKAFVERYIDLIARYKMNTFHWHLTDDQGWRFEVKKYPRLTQVGAWRAQSIVGRQHLQRDTTQWRYDGEPHGGYYTQDDAREVVAYARARFVTVVPEIEMPGHAVAAVAAYPELGLTGAPTTVATRWGVFPEILNARPATVRFMQDVLTEVMGVFPGPYVHVGGDEANKAKWKTDPEIQARIRELGLKNEDELQSWFIRQMDAFLTAHGRRMVGWDEILEGGLAPNAVVMSWRGTRGGVEAARAGHDVVMTPTSHTYLDYYQSRDMAAEPIALGGYLPLDTVYAYDPVPAELGPREARHVLGTQAQLWTEYVRDPRKAEYMLFPRVSALAEVAWTPKDRRDFADYRRRLAVELERLQAMDVNFRPLAGPVRP
ncbi:beta-N-acetylhexosaminidase [Gemmatimonadetes bacterium T265]|nr:beta-N-acetylhexosaminidase [Gemmatimonadetes bacterium T265]